MRVTRRRFLSGTLAGGFAAAFGCGGKQPATVACEAAVIGSGFAGTYLAQRLAARGIDTVIIEAGAYPTEEQHRTGMRGHNIGSVWYPIDAARHIGVGGTSHVWTGVVCRLLPEDFSVHSAYGIGADWPIAYDDLASYYCEAEQKLMTVGPPPAPESVTPRDCAYPNETEGYTFDLGAELDGLRPKFETLASSQRPGKRGPVRLGSEEVQAFEALTHARLLRRRQAIRLAMSGARGTHVETESLFDEPVAVQAEVFVVAAGTFENARLLLASKSAAHPEGLGNASGHVGKHFNEHPAFVRKVPSAKFGELPRSVYRTYSYQDRMRRNGMNACAFQLIGDRSGVLDWHAVAEMEPAESNAIRLSASKADSFGHPHVELNLNYTDRDRRTFAEAKRILDRFEQTFAEGTVENDDREVWQSHPAGLTRMAANAADGVVDAHHKIFGADNVYVSGASVFPVSGTPNPTLTVTAMTLRLADHIAREHFGKRS